MPIKKHNIFDIANIRDMFANPQYLGSVSNTIIRFAHV